MKVPLAKEVDFHFLFFIHNGGINFVIFKIISFSYILICSIDNYNCILKTQMFNRFDDLGKSTYRPGTGHLGKAP